MAIFNNYRRNIRDAALPAEDNAVGFSAGDMAIAQSLDRSAVPLQEPERTWADAPGVEVGIAQAGASDPLSAVRRMPIGSYELNDAYQILLKYREGKTNLERRLIDNQQWYKLRQWEVLRRENKEWQKKKVEPASAWLLNSIANKHADAMDNFPSANIVPREEDDKAEAKALSSIMPVVLDQCDFEQTYSDVQDDKIESGTGVYGVFWDSSKHNGLGDIDIVCVDLINLFWEPGITDIQDSRNVFYVTLQDNDMLEEEYPEFAGKLGRPVIDVNKYVYDDTIDTTDKSAVVDWYYKVQGADGKTVLHFCKFIAGCDEPLFATENDPEYAGRGWYDHGLYPFVFDRLMRCKGTPTGFGFIDIGKGAQEYIDRGDKAVLENMLFNARPRHFIRKDGGVNEAELADVNNDFVHVEGSLGQDSIMPMQVNPLNQTYVTILGNKVTELKETTGNRDVATGGTTSGVTAASAIAAMQEAGSKLSRDNNKGSYRAFRKVILLCIELMRQFYELPRWFRILGERGAEQYISFSNQGLLPQPQGTMVNGVPMEMGTEVGYRLPLFDIEVTAEKQSPYSRMAQNELALSFYQRGFFAPENADASLACLDMMDFDHKDFVMEKIERNGTLLDMLRQTQALAVQLAQTLDAEHGTALAQNMMANFGMEGGMIPGQSAGGTGVSQLEALGGDGKGAESSITAKARERVAQGATPR